MSIGQIRRGFLLGKFMPPHAGHLYLAAFAQQLVDELTILVCNLPDDPIPGRLRHEWMRSLVPGAHVIRCEEILPQEPGDAPETFWAVWRDVVRRYHPQSIDVVFASEDYGHRLAAEVGARFVPVDPARRAVPVSATAIRSNPRDNWRFLPEPVRNWYRRRVTLFGAESTGKTTLATALGRALDTVVVPEYGRTYTDAFGATGLALPDLRRIADGQAASRAAATPLAGLVVVEDTDAVLTAVWSDMLFGARQPWLDAVRDHADLYVFCDIDFPWIDDGTRYFPDRADRERFDAACARELTARGLRHVRVSGPPEFRLATSLTAIAALR